LQHSIENLRKIRVALLKLIEPLSAEELNRIPQGFNNNVIWNLAHVVASQQMICYVRAGVKPFVDEEFIALYKSGTKPEGTVSEENILKIKDIFLHAIVQFSKDYDAGVFPITTYPSWTTGYGNEILSLEDALSFVMFHEGLHRGYIMAMKRSL
jgi:uncharacterized damage-inducible protein DinB